MNGDEHAVLVEHEGLIFIEELEWTNDWNKPVKYKLSWPTGVFVRPDLLGKKAQFMGNGLVKIENGVFIALEYREKTKPSQKYSVEDPIKKKCGFREYKNGAWR
jgi:hypothetical protein